MVVQFGVEGQTVDFSPEPRGIARPAASVIFGANHVVPLWNNPLDLPYTARSLI